MATGWALFKHNKKHHPTWWEFSIKEVKLFESNIRCKNDENNPENLRPDFIPTDEHSSGGRES